jgi:hypothetical protein
MTRLSLLILKYALHHHHRDHTKDDECVAPKIHHGTTMQGECRPRPSPRQLEGLAATVVSLRCLLLGFAELWWMDGSLPLGSLGGCIYALEEPWGVIHLAHEIFLGREEDLVPINSASSKFFWFAVLPCRRRISHVQDPNNANSVPR